MFYFEGIKGSKSYDKLFTYNKTFINFIFIKKNNIKTKKSNMKYDISIIVPFYKRDEYAIQTFKNIDEESKKENLSVELVFEIRRYTFR